MCLVHQALNHDSSAREDSDDDGEDLGLPERQGVKGEKHVGVLVHYGDTSLLECTGCDLWRISGSELGIVVLLAGEGDQFGES